MQEVVYAKGIGSMGRMHKEGNSLQIAPPMVLQGCLLTTAIAIALTLTITNTLAFSRCDKFSQASTLASSAFSTGNLARNVAGGLVSRMFNRG